jgi:uncharacterized Zn-binding protein involved in type VI secretion
MCEPAAKEGDAVVGKDTHIVLVASPGGPVPTPTSLPFKGKLDRALSKDVLVENKHAAVQGSFATNAPPHVSPLGPFQKPPSNSGKVIAGSPTVLVNWKHAARDGDAVETCNDPADAATAKIVATSTVRVG